jgi:hypothetical protein
MWSCVLAGCMHLQLLVSLASHEQLAEGQGLGSRWRKVLRPVASAAS